MAEIRAQVRLAYGIDGELEQSANQSSSEIDDVETLDLGPFDES